MPPRKLMAPLLFAAAVLLAVAAAFGAKYYVAHKAQQEAERRVRTAPLVVAAVDLPAGLELSAGRLAVAQWPVEARPPGHFGAVKPLLGRVLQQPVVKGEPLLAGKLSPEGAAAGLAAAIKPGWRAVTISADEVVGVAGYLKVSDRVDVIATVKGLDQGKEAVARLALQDLEVLAVSHQAEQDGKKPPKLKGQVLTLLARPADAERLALAAGEGKILLALRNRQDRQPALTRGARLGAMVAPPPAPAAKAEKCAAPRPSPPAPTVELIKGVTRARQELKP